MKGDPADLGKCIKRSVRIAVKNVKFHSNPILAGQCIAENVGRKEEKEEDIEIELNAQLSNFSKHFFSYVKLLKIYATFSLGYISIFTI